MMLGGNSQDDGRVEDSESSISAQNGPNVIKDCIKDCIREEIRKYFSSMEKQLIHYVEKRFADLTEQQGVLQTNMEDVEKKQGVLQSSMERIEKKMDKLLQAEKRVEEKLAANCAILEMMLCQARAGSSGSSEHKAPEHQFNQGATDEPSRASGWPSCVGALAPLSRIIGVLPSQEESCRNTARHSSQPPPSNNTAITTVTTVASTIKTLQVHQQNIPSRQMPNAIYTTPTSSHLQRKDQPQPVQQPFMPSAIPRESHGQIHPDVLVDILAAAKRYHHQLSSTTENSHTRVIVQHLKPGNNMNYVVALVNDEGGQHLAVKSQSLGDHATFPSSILDQTVFPQLPPQVPRRRRASCGGTVLTDVMMLQLSRLIGHKWKSIGIECLLFSSDDLSRIDADHPDIQSKIFEMIKQWNRRQGVEGGTVEKLADLFKKSCEIDCYVFDFMDSLKESPESTD